LLAGDAATVISVDPDEPENGAAQHRHHKG
jgi:hypothetical protein